MISNNSSNFYSQLEPLIYLPLSSLNLVLSVFSLTLFICHRKELRRCLRDLLISLSGFECVMHLMIIVCYSTLFIHHSETNPLPQNASSILKSQSSSTSSAPSTTTANIHTESFMVVLFVVLRSSMTYRNYMMALLSLSRARILVLSRKRSFYLGQAVEFDSISRPALAAVLGSLLIPTILLSTFMQLGEQKILLQNQPDLLKLFRVSFFVVQGIIPILLVIVSTAITVHTLWFSTPRKMMELLGEEEDHPCLPMSSRRDRQASLIIIALSVSFVVLQAPTDVCGFIEQAVRNPLMDLLVNIPVELDSTTNFIIYTVLTRAFRDVWYLGVRSIVKRNSVGTINYCIVSSGSGLHLHYIDLREVNSGNSAYRAMSTNNNVANSSVKSSQSPNVTDNEAVVL